MKRTDKRVEALYQDLLDALGGVFDRAFLENEELLDSVSDGAFVALRLELDTDVDRRVMSMIDGFNSWSLALAESQRDPGQELAVIACHMRPLVVAAVDELTPSVIRQSCDSCAMVLA